MTCAKCGHVEANAHAIGQHWKSAHPVEFKKRQLAKKAKRAAVIEPEEANPPPDPEQQLIATAVSYFEEAMADGMTSAGAARVVEYLRSRFAGSAPVVDFNPRSLNGQHRMSIS